MNTWVLPGTGEVELYLEDVEIKTVVSLDISEKGYLSPTFYDLKINLGESFLYFENWFTQFLMWQAMEFVFVMVQNSIYFIGTFIFTDMAEPLVDKFLNSYQLPMWLRSPFPGH